MIRTPITTLILIVSAFLAGEIWQTYEHGQSERKIAPSVITEPNNALGFYERGFARFELGDKEGAVSDFDRAIAIDRKFACAYHMRGYVKQRLFDLDGARSDLREAAELNPCAEFLTDYGVILHIFGENRKAIKQCERAISIDPVFAEAFFFRAFARDALCDNEGAMADLNQTIRCSRRNYYAYFYRAKLKLRLGDKTGAKDDLQCALRINPDFDKARWLALSVQYGYVTAWFSTSFNAVFRCLPCARLGKS